MGIIIALGLCFVGFTIMTAVALYKDSELDDMKARYKTSIEFSDAMQEARDAAEDRLLLANADIEMLKLDVAHYQRVIAELEAKQEPVIEQPEPEQPRTVTFEQHTNIFRCEDYRKITDKTSDHYLLQQEAVTMGDGIRALIVGSEVYYCAALGGAFGFDIGEAWRVTLRNGLYFNVVLADFKHPIPLTDEEREAAKNDFGDPDFSYLSPKDENGQYIKDSLSVIEFIVEKEKVQEKAWKAGTLSQLPEFGGLNTYDGDIMRMSYIGRVWERSEEE